MKRLAFLSAVLISSTGCEITATAYVQQEYRVDPHIGKPDGVARAEVKITRLVGRDAKS